MATTVTVTNWTGKLTGADGTDYMLLSSGDLVTAAPNWLAVDGYTANRLKCDKLVGGYLVDDGSQQRPFTPTTDGSDFVTSPFGNAFHASYAANTGGTAARWEGEGLGGHWGRVENGVDRCLECWVYNAGYGPQYNAGCIGAGDWYSIQCNYWQNYGIRFCGYNYNQYAYREWVMPRDSWHHIAGTIDHSAQVMVVWLDGVAQTSVSVAGVDTTSYGDTAHWAVMLWWASGSKINNCRNSIGVCRYPGTTTFSPKMQVQRDVVTASGGLVDAGASATWSQVTCTCPARVSNEVYSLYACASASATPPAVGDGAWTLLGASRTGTATFSGLALSGRYLHLWWRLVPSTDALGTYQIAVDAASATWTPAFSGGGRIYRPQHFGPKLLPTG